MNRITLTSLVLATLLVTGGQTQGQPAEQGISQLIENLEQSGKDKQAVQTRRDAALMLSELGSEAAPAVPALIAALDDPDTQVWFHSVTAFSRIGDGARPAIPALVNDLRNGSRGGGPNAKWYRSAYALGNMGPASIAELVPHLENNDRRVRAGIANALGWLGEEAAVALPDLAKLLNDENDFVRAQTAESLAKIGEASLPLLESTLKADDHQAQMTALEALTHLGETGMPLVETVVSLTRQEATPDLQASALRTLVQMPLPPETKAEILWPLAQHSDEQVRHEINNGILDLPPALIVPQLIKRLHFQDLASRRWAADLLGRIGAPAAIAVPDLIEQIEAAPQADHIDTFTTAIASLGSAAIAPLFDYASQVSETEITPTHWLVTALGRFGIPGLNQFSEGLGHQSAAVRLTSIYAIRTMGTDGRPASAKMQRLLRDDNPLIRSASLLGLVSISRNPDQYAEDVQRLLADANSRARQSAAQAIPALTKLTSETIERLGELLSDQDPGVRLASANALTSVGQKAADQSEKLALLLAESDEAIKTAAVEALGEVGNVSQLVTAQIAQLADFGEGDVKLAALECLGKLGSKAPRVAKVYRNALADSSEPVRRAAVTYFKRIVSDTSENIEINSAALEDIALAIRLKAAENLGEMEESALPAVPAMMKLLTDRDNAFKYLEALKRIPSDESLYDEYMAALDNRSSIVRSFAAERLGRLREKAKPAVQKLERLAEHDESFYVRRSVETALERITGEKRED